jgi:hypothetical protein
MKIESKKDVIGVVLARLVRWFGGPRRRIRELRIDLAAVRRYNAGLAAENYRLRTELDGLGQKLIAEIIKQGMFAVNYSDHDETHLVVWAGNANEQLECVVAEFLSPNDVKLTDRHE